MALATAAEVRALIKGATSSDDTLLNTLIGYAGAVIADHCGYPPNGVSAAATIESASYVRRSGDPGCFIDSEDPTRLYLEPWPITAISYIREDEDHDFASSSTIASGDYEQRGSRGQIIELKPDSGHGSFSTVRGSVQISYTAGWSSVPNAIKYAAIEYVIFLWNERARRGLKTVSEGDLNAAYLDPGMPQTVRRALAPYRMASVYLHA